jgi:alanyl-tRNA synthetase
MTSSEIRSRFLAFFEKRGHAVIQSASLVTSDEKGITNPTLFNTAGMQPLIPYLLGKPYLIDGKETQRLASAQKCLRTVDIDDVGDRTHNTFFEMLGNWSLGDYFKKEAINWSYEFLTDEKEGLGYDEKTGFGLKPERLYVTVFEGDTNASRDNEAAKIWRDIFEKNGIDAGGDTTKGEAGRIFFMSASMNWWEAGDNGPCGPDTEMYYDIGDPKTGKPFFGGKVITKEQFISADSKREVVEVWNDVFMQYVKKDGKIIGNLPKPSVDTGAGLERLTMTMQGVDNIYDTDLLSGILKVSKKLSLSESGQRIIADHLRAATFLISDGVVPSNTDRGYVLRRLIRRAVTNTIDRSINEVTFSSIIDAVCDTYPNIYQRIHDNKKSIKQVLVDESVKFSSVMNDALHEFNRLITEQDGHKLDGEIAFRLFSSYGLPLEVTLDLARIKRPIVIDPNIRETFNKLLQEHQSLSRAGAEQKFKGGLANANDPMVVRYHTATHLLQQALHDVLGEESGNQKGSNITAERLRYDFTGVKLTDEQKKRVEDIVNEKITAKLPVNQIVLPKAEAEKTGAMHFFGEKYGDEISVYFIGPASNPPAASDLKNAYSKEFCGGPHVKNTSELAGPEGKWRFKIQKEEASSQGVRRIKAVLE